MIFVSVHFSHIYFFGSNQSINYGTRRHRENVTPATAPNLSSPITTKMLLN